MNVVLSSIVIWNAKFRPHFRWIESTNNIEHTNEFTLYMSARILSLQKQSNWKYSIHPLIFSCGLFKSVTYKTTPRYEPAKEYLMEHLNEKLIDWNLHKQNPSINTVMAVIAAPSETKIKNGFIDSITPEKQCALRCVALYSGPRSLRSSYFIQYGVFVDFIKFSPLPVPLLANRSLSRIYVCFRFTMIYFERIAVSS